MKLDEYIPLVSGEFERLLVELEYEECCGDVENLAVLVNFLLKKAERRFSAFEALENTLRAIIEDQDEEISTLTREVEALRESVRDAEFGGEYV